MGDTSERVMVFIDAGKHVEVAYPRKAHPANHLLDVCDLFTDLEEEKHLKPVSRSHSPL